MTRTVLTVFLASLPLLAAEAPGAAATRSFVRSLKEVGYHKGLTQTDPVSASNLYFRIPRDVPVVSGSFRLVFRSSPLLIEPSSLQVSINGAPRTAIPLGQRNADQKAASDGQAAQELSVPLIPADWREPIIAVTVRSSMVTSRDASLDERAGVGFLQILPETGLSLEFPRELQFSLRAFWETLPEIVVLSVPAGTLSAEEFVTAWRVYQLLERRGKTVRIARLPETGDVVVAPRKALGGASERWVVRADANVQVCAFENSAAHFLLVTDPFPYSLDLLTPDWSDLGAGNHYDVHSIVPETKGAPLEEIALSLDQLGLSNPVRFSPAQAEWKVTVDARHFPGPYVPRRITVEVIAQTGPEEQSAFSAFWNEHLLGVERLKGAGRPQQLTFALPEAYGRTRNELRFLVQRNDPRGRAGFPVQLSGASVLTARLRTAPPERLWHLSGYLRNGYTAFLPAGAFESPEQAITALSRIHIALDLPVDNVRAVRHRADQPVRASGPFVAVSPAPLAGIESPVQTEAGRINILDNWNRPLLKLDRLPGLAVAQVGRSGEAYGLSLLLPEGAGLPAPEMLDLGAGDVAFFDSAHTALTLDTRQGEAVKVRYLERLSWQERLWTNRFLLLAAALFATALVFLRIYRRWYEGRIA